MDSGSNDLLSSLLSNPESLKLIAGIAKNFLSTQNTSVQNSSSDAIMQTANPSPEQNTPSPKESNEQMQNSIVQSVVPAASAEEISASAVIGKGVHNSFDDRANLLNSIKPYLNTQKKQKVDSLVKALNLAKVINTYTDIGTIFK